jgi:large subunit ribosomal protein L17
MFRALCANLVAHERIETTDAKAKELRRVTERLITRAIRLGPVAYTPHDKLNLSDRARRSAAQQHVSRFLRRFAVVPDGQDEKKIDLVEKVFLDLAKRFKDRPGGYTRIIKLGRRRGDNAPMSLIEFVDFAGPGKGDKVPKAEGKKSKAAPEAKTESAEAAPKSEAKSSEVTEAKAAAADSSEASAAAASEGQAKSKAKAAESTPAGEQPKAKPKSSKPPKEKPEE